MNARQPPSRARILIALASTDAGESAIETASLLTAGSAAELLGLYFENTRLLAHARSPLAREIMLSGRERALELQRLERQIHAQSGRARTGFEAAAARRQLRHAFQVAEGELIAELTRCAAEAEAIVFGMAASEAIGASAADMLQALARTPVRSLLLTRAKPMPGAPILAAIENPAAAPLLLDTAARIAYQARAPLMLLLAGEAATHSLEFLERQLPVLGAPGVRITAALRTATLDAVSTAAAARRVRARLVVLPSRGAAWDPERAGRLLRALPSSLLLLRGQSPPAGPDDAA
jgi:hypothetical protein